MRSIDDVLKYSYDLKVLYIEDDDTYLEDSLEVFSRFFAHIDVAKDGEEGLEKYIDFFKKNNRYYDIVISDICMPKLNGVELTKRIYKHNKDQIIIIISAHSEVEYLKEFVNIGIEYFLNKPFDLVQILDLFYTTSKKLYSDNIVDINSEYQWDRQHSILLFNNKEVLITRKEKKFIEILVEKSNIVKTEEIMHHIWGDQVFDISSNVLKPLVSRLKKKLPKPLIKNIYGVGYKLQKDS